MTRRRTFVLLAALGVPVLLVLLLLAWVIHTESGTQWSASLAVKQSGGKLQLSDISGSWAERVSVASVQFHNGPIKIKAGNVSVAINLGALLARRLVIRSVSVSEITVDYPPPQARVSAAQSPREGPLTLPLDIELIDGNIDRLILKGPGDQTIESLKASGLWAGEVIQVSSFAAATNGIKVQADGRFDQATDDGLSAVVSWSQSKSDFSGHGTISGSMQKFEVTHELAGPYAVKSAGLISLGDHPLAQITSTAPRLSFDRDGRAADLENITLALDGWVDEFRASWSGEAIISQIGRLDFQGSGAGDLNSFRFEEFEADLRPGLVSLQGDLSWSEGLRWNASVAMSGLEPALIASGFPDRVEGRLDVSGHYLAQVLHVEIKNIDVVTTVGNQKIRGSGGLRVSGDQVELDQVQLVNGDNQLSLHGAVAPVMNAKFQAKVPDIGVATGMNWAGSVQGRGELLGDWSAPTLDIDLAAEGVRIEGFGADALSLAGRLEAEGPGSNLIADATGLSMGETLISSLTASINGSVFQHTLDVSLESQGRAVQASFVGGLTDRKWSGEIGSSQLTLDNLGIWRQAKPTQLVIGEDQLEVNELCFQNAESSACIRGAARTDLLAVNAEVLNLPVAAASQYLPPGVTVSGSVNGNVELAGTLDAPSIKFSSETRSLSFTYSLDGGQENIEAKVSTLQLRGSADTETIDLKLEATGPQESRLTMAGQILDWRTEQPRVLGNASAGIPDTAFLAMLTTELSEWQGILSVELGFSGDIKKPLVDGFVKLHNARAAVPRAGIVLDKIDLEARTISGRRIDITGTARSGEGNVSLRAGLDLDGDLGWPITGSIEGERFSLLNLPGLELDVSPTIQIAGSARALKITGTLATSKAIVEVRELPEQAVDISPDVRILGGEEVPSGPDNRAVVSTEIVIILGETVRFSGFGLRTDLTGRMVVNTETGKAAQGRGVVKVVSGQFKAYGQDLDIENGQLVFTGSLADPTIVVDAVRRIDSVKTGIRLRGSARAPQATIFSEPAMSEANALSYLIIGRPLNETTRAEGDQLMNSAVALGLKQAMPITQQIGRSIGLDELGLDSDSTDSGAVMAGKQISSDLYVRYSYGLFSRIGAVLLRYELNDRLSLEARSSEDQSLDLIYTRERK